MHTPAYDDSVFINCPFDDRYEPIFAGLVFAIFDCGFVPRCALEEGDSSVLRMDRIYRTIESCRYGIHDISRTESDPRSRLPRFNVPLELGIFLGAKQFGQRRNKQKMCLILDSKAYRYQKFMSDISGFDIESHSNRPLKAIEVTNNWLRHKSRRKTLPGAAVMQSRYRQFRQDLPRLCRRVGLDRKGIAFHLYNDYCHLVSAWAGQMPVY